MRSAGTQEFQSQELERLQSDIQALPLVRGLIQSPADLIAQETGSDHLLCELDVPLRVLRCFETLGIKTIRDLFRMSSEDLLSTPRLGKRSLSQVRVALKDYFKPNNRKSTKNRWAHLMDLYVTYHSYEAVGRQLGVSRQRVQQLISFGERIGALPHDLVCHIAKLRKKQRANGIALKVPREVLIQDYASLGSMRKIAKRYCMSRYTLSKLLNHYELSLSSLRSVNG